MNARVKADPSLIQQRRCAAEHPFGTIKRMTAGGRFLTRGLKKRSPAKRRSALWPTTSSAPSTSSAQQTYEQASPEKRGALGATKKAPETRSL
jgi:hypothetical protein